MSRAINPYQDPDTAEQPSLLSRMELAELRCPSASRPRKVEIASCKACRQDIGERFIRRAGAIQPKLPGL
jgi:hypothetical protein